MTEKKKLRSKRRRKELCGIYRIDIGDGFSAFCRYIGDENYQFFDLKNSEILSATQIADHPIAFTIPVGDTAVQSGRWELVGVAQDFNCPTPAPKYFKQDIFTGKISIYEDGDFRPASRTEAEDLERLSVWSWNHVEDRLRDHFAGRPNVWVDQLALK